MESFTDVQDDKLYVNEFKNALTSDNTKLNASAHRKLSTLNPGTSLLTNNTNTALMTNVNSPSVKMVIGNVRITRIGLRMVLTSPKITATTTAVRKFSTFTPGNI